jgi:hypothetical protein
MQYVHPPLFQVNQAFTASPERSAEVNELFSQLVVICDGKSKGVITDAVSMFLRREELEIVNAKSLKTVRKQAEMFRVLTENIGGALTAMVHALDEQQDDLQQRSKTLKSLHDKIMASLELNK